MTTTYWNCYFIGRGALYFNTTSIPSTAAITNAKLTLDYSYYGDDFSATDFDIVVTNGQPTYPHAVLETGDYNKAYYSGNGGSINTLNLPSPFDITLNSTGISWINRGGMTKFILRSNRDISGTTPTGYEYIILDNEYGNKPKLTLTYHNMPMYQSQSMNG
jgi:hypothetical protein